MIQQDALHDIGSPDILKYLCLRWCYKLSSKCEQEMIFEQRCCKISQERNIF